jgi:hypothetical protein
MSETTPPRNIIYFDSNANQIPLEGIAALPYTDVIVGFLVPDAPASLFCSQSPSRIDPVHQSLWLVY